MITYHPKVKSQGRPVQLPGRPGRYVFFETQSGLCNTYLGKEMLTAALTRREGEGAMQKGGRALHLE